MRNEKVITVCKSTLKSRGWTDKAIQIFYNEPFKQVNNPRYRSSAKMRLYSLDEVEQIEGTKEFMSYIAIYSRDLGIKRMYQIRLNNAMSQK